MFIRQRAWYRKICCPAWLFRYLRSMVSVLLIVFTPLVYADNLSKQELALSLDEGWRADLRKPVIIAIVDDGFLLAHPDIKDFIWKNSAEVANNGLDDDSNGLVDDIHGWDVADGDNNVAPLVDRFNEFNHGTYVASIIVQVIKAKLGARDDYPIKLLPVKAISDNASQLNLKDGYLGIDYALLANADIINNSWDGGRLDSSAGKTLNQARLDDVFVVNSVGNFPVSSVVMPASHPAVFGVANSDKQGVIRHSNYGIETDILAPGTELVGSDISRVDVTMQKTGTSVAAPIVSATVALMKLANPNLTVNGIRDCLLNTAKSVEVRNPMIAGKVGAGLIQIDPAIECAKAPKQYLAQTYHQTPKGSIGKNYKRKDKNRQPVEWHIVPAGVYQGISLKSSISGDLTKTSIEILNLSDVKQPVLWSGNATDFPSDIEFKSSRLKVRLIPNKRKEFDFRLNYAVKPIDFEKRYCSGEAEVRGSTVITDGSGQAKYAGLSDCAWLIKPDANKSLQLEFTEFDIDESDKLYLFAGNSRRQRDLLNSFNGQKLPPRVIIERGAVLLWLVSDSSISGQGFELNVKQIPLVGG